MSTSDHPAGSAGRGVSQTFVSLDAWASSTRILTGDSTASRPAGSPTQRPLPEAWPYRPTVRDPMALLRIVDDGSADGEVIRIRGNRIVIGRATGEVVIPHDISMSPRHAVIERQEGGVWMLGDLGSQGGTFVRVTSARLLDGSDMLVGRTRLRFQAVDLTEGWLVEELPDRPGTRHECHAPVASIGRTGSGCSIELNDPFVSPLHAQVHRTPRGWMIENAGINGLWIRIVAPIRMAAASQFQCGEQRFVFVPCT